jgi:signal-transduction protein with cAMP-binding, CBS, and nucleotidyltransferase domain
VSSGDVLANAQTRLEALDLDPPVRVSADESLQAVARRMQVEEVSALLVGADPPSFVSERDLAHALAAGLGPEAPVGEVATELPRRVTETMTLGEAAATMVSHGVRHLIVVNDSGDTVGVLSMRGALRILLREVEPSGWQRFFSSRG